MIVTHEDFIKRLINLGFTSESNKNVMIKVLDRSTELYEKREGEDAYNHVILSPEGKEIYHEIVCPLVPPL